jgi:hypothetical protein
MQHLETAVSGTLSLEVEVASCIRVGDTQHALALLDLRIDTAVLKLTAAASNLGFLAAQAEQRPARALGQAKLYRHVIPSTDSDASAVRSALDKVPAPEGTAPVPSGLAKLTQHAGG